MHDYFTKDKLLSDKIKETENGCWEYIGQRHKFGYGVLKRKGIVLSAHRVAWELTFGEIPEGMCVCHKCDNPPCCNPDHLFLGSHQDNMDDMKRKGRHVRIKGNQGGSKNYNAKLTESKVESIRRMYKEGMTQVHLGEVFGVSNSTIHLIVHDKVWK